MPDVLKNEGITPQQMDEFAAAYVKSKFDDYVPRRLEEYFFLPETIDQFQNVFGRSPRKKATDEMERARQLIVDDFGLGGSDRSATATSFEQVLLTSTATYIMVVGHNEGNALVFPDGSRISFERLFQLSDEGRKRLVLISCNALRGVSATGSGQIAATAGVLSLEEGVMIAKAVTDELRNSTLSGIALPLLQGVVTRAELRVGRHLRTKVMIHRIATTTGTAVAFIVLIEVLDCADAHHDNPFCSLPLGAFSRGQDSE